MQFLILHGVSKGQVINEFTSCDFIKSKRKYSIIYIIDASINATGKKETLLKVYCKIHFIFLKNYVLLFLSLIEIKLC